MKRGFLYLIITIFLPLSFSVLDAQGAQPSDTISGYFKALKNGDVGTIKQYIAGDFYKKYKVLLENNEDYPDFLKNFYQGAELSIGDSVTEGDEVVVRVEIYFPNGNTSVNKLGLKKYGNNTWKIVEEIKD